MSSGNPETRARILDAAWHLLEAADGREVRMGDIAKRAGVSRQAVYLHFPKRAELLIATTRHIDRAKGVDARLAASRNAGSGVERLDAFVEAWGNYIPEIHGVGRALMAMREHDPDAKAAWDDRMQAVRQGCEAAIRALAADGDLTDAFSPAEATDLLWTMLSVRTWEALRTDCGWSQRAYVDGMKAAARRLLVARDGRSG